MIPKKEKVEYVSVKLKVNKEWKKEFEDYCMWLNGDKDLDYFFNQVGRQELDTNVTWKKHLKQKIKSENNQQQMEIEYA